MGTSKMSDLEIAQLGDGPWLVTIDGKQWDAVVRVDATGGRAIEVVSPRFAAVVPAVLDWWVTGRSVTLSRGSTLPNDFGNWGSTHTFFRGPLVNITPGATAPVDQWISNGVVIARRVIVDGATYIQTMIPAAPSTITFSVSTVPYSTINPPPPAQWRKEKRLTC
jgi:hypothetical protein